MSYDKLLKESVDKFLTEAAAPGMMNIIKKNYAAGVAGKKVTGKVGQGMLATGAKIVGGNRMPLAVGGAALGAVALWRMKKNKCKQNCLSNPDPAARQQCIAGC